MSRKTIASRIGGELDMVYLRLHKGYHLPGKPSRKWSPQRAAPFKIVRKVHNLAYKLDFPKSWKVWPVVSAAQLYKVPQEPDPFERVTPPPPPVIVNDEEQWELERIYLGWEDMHNQWVQRVYLVDGAREMYKEKGIKRKEYEAIKEIPKLENQIRIDLPVRKDLGEFQKIDVE
ncbi:uncharacterized protein B0T15DRAFT_514644 [Chaetomium strumarium]|uniref:Tf2-1-like SH3-like domain-containing protein n=1 Tax=Chaetomium strumarium TaxID=1170767 RepID=A0AAJ0GME2_9PEZI|nr:hypothetical protein B0T15DRAFT_514644 [Chaetomium strumarium]